MSHLLSCSNGFRLCGFLMRQASSDGARLANVIAHRTCTHRGYSLCCCPSVSLVSENRLSGIDVAQYALFLRGRRIRAWYIIRSLNLEARVGLDLFHRNPGMARQ